MEVHRQQCQTCGSIRVHDILVRESGQPQTVFVVCAECHGLVARYRLQEYYHHGKGADSFIRSRQGKLADSGRELLDEYRRTQREVAEQHARVLAVLAEQHKPLDPAGYPTPDDAAHAEDDDARTADGGA